MPDHREEHPGVADLAQSDHRMALMDDYCARVKQHVERYYGIHVVITKIPVPFTADLDGLNIYIDPGVTPEARLFLLAHLFGHTVQWNTDARNVAIGKAQRLPVDESLLPALLAYEREAASYGLDLMHRAGIRHLDRWFANYSACDEAVLEIYYRTGKKPEFSQLWRDDSPLRTPKTVPEFIPVKRTCRFGGIVI